MLLSKMFVEERNGSLPGELRPFWVKAGCGVIVESMLQPFVDIGSILFIMLFQGSFVRWPASIDASVLLGEVEQQWCLNLRN